MTIIIFAANNCHRIVFSPYSNIVSSNKVILVTIQMQVEQF